MELEKTLEGVTQDLAVAESTLTMRNAELDTLQCNLKELEELREMKEVALLYFHHQSMVLLTLGLRCSTLALLTLLCLFFLYFPISSFIDRN